MPKVSIIIPLYNMERYIKECVQSALDQTYPDMEVVVVNDGSTDGSLRVVEEFGLAVRVINQDNQGPARALNNGLRAATGKYVAWMGADDAYMPGYLESQVEKLEADSSIAVSYSDYIMVDSEGRETRTVRCPYPGSGGRALAVSLLSNNFINGAAVVMRRECHDNAGYYDETLRASADGDMWFRLIMHGYRFAHVPEPLVRYRWHPGNLSHKLRLMQKYTDIVHNKAIRSFAEKGIISAPSDFERLARAFASQMSFNAAVFSAKRALESGGSVGLWLLLQVCRVLRTRAGTSAVLALKGLRRSILEARTLRSPK